MGSSLAGALSVAVFNRLYNNRRIINSHLKKQKQQQEHFVKPLNTAKQELQSLQFEKNLVSEAITRVYEAMQEKKIDVIERDRLLTKYKRQLNSYNERIAELQSTIDLKEIGEVRNNLVSLLEERIKGIDQKLDELSYKTGIPLSDNNNIARTEKRQEEERGTVATINNNKNNNNYTQQRQKPLKDDLSLTPPSQLTNPQKSADKRVSGGGGKKAEEKNIEELQKEIMESLARLEQVELDDNEEEEQEVLHKPSIDKKEEEVGGNNNKKLDALANF
jgi:chromosome segregation ATPase